MIVIAPFFRAAALRYWMMFALLMAATPVLAEAPRVVVSIKPLHALVSEVMSGVGEPMLLFSNSASPHDTRLRPSRVRALSRAQLVVWVGPALERSLASTLVNINSANRHGLAALDLPELKKLAARLVASGSRMNMVMKMVTSKNMALATSILMSGCRQKMRW